MAAFFDPRWAAPARHAFAPTPASAAGRFRGRSAAQTSGCRWSVGQIGLSKAAAAPRHDASSFRSSSARGKLFASCASFERQNEAFENLSLLQKSRSNLFLGGHSSGADRALKKATECQLLFFGASVSTFDFRLPRPYYFIIIHSSPQFRSYVGEHRCETGVSFTYVTYSNKAADCTPRSPNNKTTINWIIKTQQTARITAVRAHSCTHARTPAAVLML